MKRMVVYILFLASLGCATTQQKPICSWLSEFDLNTAYGKSITIAVVGEKGVPYMGTTVRVESIDGKEMQQQVIPIEGKVIFHLNDQDSVYKISFKTWCQSQYYNIEEIPMKNRENSTIFIKIPDGFCPEVSI